MSIPEIQTFRQKFPQYDDMDDFEIANKLATKYPDAYGDLPDKLSVVTQIPMDTELSAGNFPSMKQITPQEQAIASNIANISRMSGMRASDVASQYEGKTPETGLRMTYPTGMFREPTTKQAVERGVGGMVINPMIAAGLATNPIGTGIGLGVGYPIFKGLNYLGQKAVEAIPSTPQTRDIKDLVGTAGYLGGFALGGKATQKVSEFVTPKVETGLFNTAKSILNFRLKPSKDLKKYSDPAGGIIKEGLWGRSLEHLKTNIDTRLGELDLAKERLKMDASNLKARIDIKDSLKPIKELVIELKKLPNAHKEEIKQIETILKDVKVKFPNMKKLSIDEAYALRDAITMLKPVMPFSKTSHSAISNALRESYHNVVKSIVNNKDVSSDLRVVNKRLSNIISAKDAVQDAIGRNPNLRWLPLPLLASLTGGSILGGPAGVALGVGSALGETTMGSTLIGKMLGGEKFKKP